MLILEGIIGDCKAENGACTIENSVNMGSVTFRGDVSGNHDYLLLGGIAGYLYSYKYDSTLKNCANYGDVTDSGESKDSYVGGIVGESYSSSSSNRVYIYNCLNHGTITHNGTTVYELCLGGIAGCTYYTIIENCVSGGNISLLTKSYYNYIGSIIGSASSDTSISNCYFTSDLGNYNKYGYAYSTPSVSNTLSYDNITFELSETVSAWGYIGTSLIGALNAAADFLLLPP